MARRIQFSQRLFYFGLFLVLSTGILSAMGWLAYGNAVPALMLGGAGLALAGRLWHHRLRQAVRSRDAFVDLAGYPLDLLRSPRFEPRKSLMV